MISIATTVVAMTGLSWHEVLWQFPVALSYQLHLLYWQRQGTTFLIDSRNDIRRILENGRQQW